MRKIFGHRGLPRIYKENTFTGINKAYEYCDFVEIDVRLTKDNNLILFHDPNIGDYLIKDLTLAELEILLNDASLADYVLTTREQLLGKINFEIKTDSLDDSQIDILFQKMLSILEPEDIVSSFNWKAIQSFKDLFNSSYGIILDKEEQLFQAQSLSNHDENLFFMAHHTLIDSRNFELPKDKTVLWTVNDEKDFQRYMEMEIFGIVTDIPDTMQLYRK
ncbi:MAG: glycerophosphodiester phosphodiesterase [Actinomycetota bacterium]|nr:glycerophosphodiester phosphodiesterase [Candidatus Actinomarina sp.]MDA2946906.1 glycerophosphodiester phosphodiesterase [Actinomycetota bacterium]MDA3008780.1 glycerophosphodiester phosphodiesterase [Actinomycetota bacterium]MDA3037028.1 glycerophosphodiester phosphodiesterase [Actinomycetota bacterium]